MLKLINISKTFNKNTVNQKIIFKNFNFSIAKGEFVVIIGSNGSGKSTLMNLISGKLTADEGSIKIDGVDVSNQPEYVRAKQVGRVFQDPLMGTASNMRIYENLAMASRKGKKLGLKWCISKADFEKYKNIVENLGLGLENNLNSKVGLLSGGQRQALTLLMATIQKPKILLLDEHTSALDPKTANLVLTHTKKIVEENNLTTLMITHNMNDAINFGTRLVMLSGGKVIFEASGKEKENLTAEILFKKFSDVEHCI